MHSSPVFAEKKITSVTKSFTAAVWGGGFALCHREAFRIKGAGF
jgi:hypothetical protein